ncbi:DUF1810 domain-containing protein [Amaricoccus macauensis]|uniref:DUF1810 domain-containing protein n=1 Tax=Amaricoccus macauensis TaxID=57001 RepID=UPI003C7AA4CD
MSVLGLARFHKAQESMWPVAHAELSAGRKVSHWMWFIFPQIAGLGRSGTAAYYAIASRAEARAYLDDEVLGQRLRDAVATLLTHRSVPAETILGSVDAMKLRSCLTLFRAADPRERLFDEALDTFFDGEPDPLTLQILNAEDRAET